MPSIYEVNTFCNNICPGDGFFCLLQTRLNTAGRPVAFSSLSAFTEEGYDHHHSMLASPCLLMKEQENPLLRALLRSFLVILNGQNNKRKPRVSEELFDSVANVFHIGSNASSTVTCLPPPSSRDDF